MLDRQFVTIIICCIPTLNCGWIPKLKRFVYLVLEQEPVPAGTRFHQSFKFWTREWDGARTYSEIILVFHYYDKELNKVENMFVNDIRNDNFCFPQKCFEGGM